MKEFSPRATFVIRACLSVGVTIIMIGGGWLALGWPKYPGNAALLVVWLAVFVITGLVWAVVWGPSVMAWVGELFGRLFMPSDKNFRIRPEYSIAESKAIQGRWDEAIEAFRADIEKFPDEAYPHIRIAEIQMDKLKNRAAATSEFLAALNKTASDDAYCLVARRLVDLYLTEDNGITAACGLLGEIQHRYPGTRHAKAAAEMMLRLQSMADNATVKVDSTRRQR